MSPWAATHCSRNLHRQRAGSARIQAWRGHHCHDRVADSHCHVRGRRRRRAGGGSRERASCCLSCRRSPGGSHGDGRPGSAASRGGGGSPQAACCTLQQIETAAARGPTGGRPWGSGSPHASSTATGASAGPRCAARSLPAASGRGPPAAAAAATGRRPAGMAIRCTSAATTAGCLREQAHRQSGGKQWGPSEHTPGAAGWAIGALCGGGHRSAGGLCFPSPSTCMVHRSPLSRRRSGRQNVGGGEAPAASAAAGALPPCQRHAIGIRSCYRACPSACIRSVEWCRSGVAVGGGGGDQGAGGGPRRGPLPAGGPAAGGPPPLPHRLLPPQPQGGVRAAAGASWQQLRWGRCSCLCNCDKCTPGTAGRHRRRRRHRVVFRVTEAGGALAAGR
mmetsp:Transcript_441/g.1315  ORF Transcript_441/g.1315 Transcript_441/m.1315 type:complete len:391 (+) Transcript_441:165-1337(+)